METAFHRDGEERYAQRLRHYLPALKAKGVSRVLVVVNGSPASCAKLAELLDLPAEVPRWASDLDSLQLCTLPVSCVSSLRAE